TDKELTGLNANVVGYPGEYDSPPRQGTLWGDSSPPLSRPEALRLKYRIDTTPGQSGSSVFYLRQNEGDAISVAIHNYGVERVSNYATRITEPVRTNLRAWRDEGGGV